MDLTNILPTLYDIPIFYFLCAILLNTLIAIFGAMFYKILFYAQEEDLGFFKSFAIIHLSQILNFFAPLKTGVIFGKPLITKLIGKMPLTKSIFAVGFENVFSMGWQLAILPLLLLLIGEKTLFDNIVFKIIIIIFFFTLFGVAAYKYKWFIPKLIRLKRFLPSRIRKIGLKFGLTGERINEIINDLPSYFSNKWLMAILSFLTIVQILLYPLFISIALALFNIKIVYIDLFAIYWISYILGRLSFLPAGIGVKDVTMAGLLVGFGVSGINVVKVIVLFRVLTFAPYLIVGGMLFLYYGHKYTYRVFFKRDLNES